MATQPHDEHRSRHRRPAVVLAIVGLVVVAGLFAQRAWTRFATMAKVAKTSEAVQNLEHIQQAQAAYFETHGTFLALGATPQRALDPADGLHPSTRTNGCDWAGSPIHPCVASTRSPSPHPPTFRPWPAAMRQTMARCPCS